MCDSLYIIFTVILIVEFIIGNLGNGFIVVVNIMDWVKTRKISSVDQILTALAISRIVLLWLVLLNWWLPVIYPGRRNTETMMRVMYSTGMGASHFSLWFATILSIFYFLKIANFSNTIFLYLKMRVKKVVTLTLLVSLVFLYLNIVVLNVYTDVLVGDHKTNSSYNSSWKSTQVSVTFLLVNTMVMFLPFALSLITFLLLIISLWKHLRRMQHSAQGCRDARTTAQVRIMQTMIASLLLYAIVFLSFLVKDWSSLMLERKLIILFSQAARTAFPSGHSCVLILANRKLRRASVSVLWWLRCRKKDAEGH
uniref:Taste receptor type 2 n=1 Tax=Nannospalax galili TaxID=1026970 RepID=A0A7S6B5X3_NANGA|nr:taste receptor type 2 member 116 [Nannospalax galili]